MAKEPKKATKSKKRERGSIFFEEPFLLSESLNWRRGERIETIQVRKEHENFEKISKGSKRGWKLILVSRCDHVVALLSG